uniref:uncharacterized protein LOC120889509 isoform X1 n=1 Tax=Ictidomys tridecemlineatus TaxID=43179 RepID=UPI001A9EAE09|nr:uncharacterized protein LOC120889509 isoform X1 [Ictidomys tridecemlineatus]
MGKARQGETGGVERVSSLRGESGQAGEGPPGGEPTRHWPPEPVAKAGITGSDGAVIGAFKLKTGDKGLQQGCTRQPPKARTPGAGMYWKDMTWSGVMARTEGLPSGLREHSGWHHGAGCHRRVWSFAFPKELTHHCCSLDPLEPSRNKEMVLPSSRLGLQLRGLLQVRLALDQEYAAFGNHCIPDSGIGSVGEAKDQACEHQGRTDPQHPPPNPILVATPLRPADHQHASLCFSSSSFPPTLCFCLSSFRRLRDSKHP